MPASLFAASGGDEDFTRVIEDPERRQVDAADLGDLGTMLGYL